MRRLVASPHNIDVRVSMSIFPKGRQMVIRYCATHFTHSHQTRALTYKSHIPSSSDSCNTPIREQQQCVRLLYGYWNPPHLAENTNSNHHNNKHRLIYFDPEISISVFSSFYMLSHSRTMLMMMMTMIVVFVALIFYKTRFRLNAISMNDLSAIRYITQQRHNTKYIESKRNVRNIS